MNSIYQQGQDLRGRGELLQVADPRARRQRHRGAEIHRHAAQRALQRRRLRNKAALGYHVNLSLSAVNILRLQERARGHKVVSLASVKRRKYNELFMERVFSMLDLDPESPEIQPLLEPLRDFGRMAA